jgi:hypothetical protein
MPKRVLDRYDLEAEREGAAVSRSRQQVCKPFGWNKGIAAQRRMHKDGAARVECRTVKQKFERYAHA